ncbi:hypothetical protein JCM16418_454 [Paenibacillus pini JCM 16418]|uniref:JAB domain-containing protein n=2 Tax=Paenibacillus TaxID=44249 RepID=W7YDH1_9BACL|nr:hypothetical protein JCM16418_454 [Paenibacillus pini JCM 16418]
MLNYTCLRMIAEHLFLHLPMEICGVLRGTSQAGRIHIIEFIPILNTSSEPFHHFTLQPEEWIRQCLNPQGLIGIVHSHPRTPPIPSSEDLNQLPMFGQLIQTYFIASPAPDGVSIHMNAYRVDTSENPPSPILRQSALQITN